MTKFIFQTQDEDEGAITTIEFESDVWLDAFPHFLNLMRASGFAIDFGTALYSPKASESLFSDRDFMLFDSDLKQVCKGDCEHSKEYYCGVGRNS
jgi:hypothetical protein